MPIFIVIVVVGTITIKPETVMDMECDHVNLNQNNNNSNHNSGISKYNFLSPSIQVCTFFSHKPTQNLGTLYTHINVF